MKQTFRKIIYVIVLVISSVYILIYKLKNFKKKRLIIYTDSRGFEITRMWNRKTPFNSYLLELIKKYNCDVKICPEKHTTFFDFFYYLDKKKISNYEKVICHIGVVDFSPRTLSGTKKILLKKKNKIERIFGDYSDFFMNLKDYEIIYKNEKTSSIIHESQISLVANQLNLIPNLVWISCNPTVKGWEGNYKGERPSNINMVNSKSKVLIKELNSKISVLDLTKWSSSEIKEYTCDNIHLSQKGMIEIERLLTPKLNP